MNNSAKVLKIDFNQDIRRIPLEECTYSSLIKQVKQLYNLQEGSFVLKYKDEEGDLVTIGSEEEFEETKGCFQQKMLRLSVFEKKKEEERSGRCGKWKKWGCKSKEGNDQLQYIQDNQERHFGNHERRFGDHGNHHGHHGPHRKPFGCHVPHGSNDRHQHGPHGHHVPHGHHERHHPHGHHERNHPHGHHVSHGKPFGHHVHHERRQHGHHERHNLHGHHVSHGKPFGYHGHHERKYPHGHHERHQHGPIGEFIGHHVSHGHHGHHGKNFGLMRGLKEMAGKLIKEGKCENFESFLNSEFCTIQHNNICDGCETVISGTRYHYKSCKDFDFCSKCFEEKIKSHDSNHQFEKISALDALKQAFRNGQQIDSFFTQKSSSNSVGNVVDNKTESSNTSSSSTKEEPKVEEQKIEQQKVEEQQPKGVKSFSMKLEELETLGFKDRKRNIQLLLKNKGDLHLTLQELTN